MHGYLLKIPKPNVIENIFINGVFRIAVPFFFITSGYLFFKTMNKGNVSKWFKHIIKIYLLWSLIYIYKFGHIFFSQEFTSISKLFHFIWLEIIGVSHLWFIPSLLVSALICLSLNRFVRLRQREILYICLFLWVIGFSLNWFMIYSGYGYNRIFIFRNGLLFGLPLFLLGYLISNNESIILKSMPSISKWMIIAILLNFFESIITFYFLKGIESKVIYSLDILLSTPPIAFLLFILTLKRKDIDIFGYNARVSSTFMYYSHIIFLEFFSYLVSSVFEVSRMWNLFISLFTIAFILTLSYFFPKKLSRVI